MRTVQQGYALVVLPTLRPRSAERSSDAMGANHRYLRHLARDLRPAMGPLPWIPAMVGWAQQLDPKPIEPPLFYEGTDSGISYTQWWAATQEWVAWHSRNPHPFEPCKTACDCGRCNNCPLHRDALVHRV